MKHAIKKTKKKIVPLLALLLTARHLTGPVLAAEIPEEPSAEMPAEGAAEQVVIIPESDYIYVNGSNKIFSVAGDLTALMRLTVTSPGRVHILTSGVEVSLVLYDEAAGEVRGVYTSENGVMDASFDAAVGTYLLGFSGWGEVAVLAADEARTEEIFAESGVQSKPAADAPAETAPSGEAGTDASGEAMSEAAEDTKTEAAAPAEPDPIAIRLTPNETTSLLPFLTAAGLPVKSIIWVEGDIDGRLVSAASGGDWLLTPLTYFDNIELSVRTSDADITDPSGNITVYTVLISNPDPEAETSAEAEAEPAEETLEEQPAEETSDEKSGTESSVEEPAADETTEEQPEADAPDEDPAAEPTEAPAEPAEATEPITYQAENGKTFPVLPILADAGAPVNVITGYKGEFEGKLGYIFQNGDLLLTPYNYFEDFELTVTATDFLAPSPEEVSATYTVLISNPDPAAPPAEEEISGASPEDGTAGPASGAAENAPADASAGSSAAPPMNITISMERAEGNAVHLFTEDTELRSGDNYSFQWQVSPDNEQWVDVEGATEPDYNFTLDSSNSHFYWRLLITDKENADDTVTE